MLAYVLIGVSLDRYAVFPTAVGSDIFSLAPYHE